MAEYWQALDAADAQENAVPEEITGLQEKIKHWQAREAQARERLDRLQMTGASQLSATDPDSRGMKGNAGHLVGYNVQGVVDASIICWRYWSQTNLPVDQGQLPAGAQAAKTELQIEQADVLADGGYFKHQDIKACQEMGIGAASAGTGRPGRIIWRGGFSV